MSIIRQIPYTRMPPSTARIDPAHPIGSTVYMAVFSGNDGGSVDAVSGSAPITNIVSNRQHDGYEFLADAVDRIQIPTTITTLQRGAVTWYYRNTDVMHASFNYHWQWDGSSGSDVSLRTDQTMAVRINTRTRIFDTSPVDLADGKGHWITTNYWQGSGVHPQTLYIDGVLIDTINGELFGVENTHTFIGIGGLGSFASEGIVNLHLIHDRNLTDGEIKSLHDNPWQIFKPRTHIIPTFVAAAATIFGVIPRSTTRYRPIMAREFNGTSDKLLDTSKAVITGRPATLAAWVKPSSIGSGDWIWGVSSASNSSTQIALTMLSGGSARAWYRNDAGNNGAAQSSTSLSTTKWNHVVGTFGEGAQLTPTGIKCYFNGVAEGIGQQTATSAFTPTQTEVGVLQRTGADLYFPGSLAGIAAWNVILTPDEIRRLAGGESPANIRPDNLVHFPDIGSTPVTDAAKGKVNYTITGTSVVSTPLTIPERFTQLIPVGLVGGGPIAYFKSLAIAGVGALGYSRKLTLGRAYSYSGSATPTLGKRLALLIKFVTSATGTSSFSSRAVKLVSLAFSALGSSVYSRAITFRRAFSLGGSATLTKQRAIAVEKQLSGTGFPEHSNDTSIEVTSTHSGVGSSALSSDLRLSKAFSYASSASSALIKKIGKGFSFIGRGISALTGDGIEPDSGRGVLRLILRTLTRNKERDK